jgi:hypothetical protein
MPVGFPVEITPGTDVAIGATYTGDEVVIVDIDPIDVGIGGGETPVGIDVGIICVGIGVCSPAGGTTGVGTPGIGAPVAGIVVGTATVGTDGGTTPEDGVPTVRVPVFATIGYRFPFRFWTPMPGSGVITMLVLPVAVPFTVRVARRTPVPPTGTCCDRSTPCRTTRPAGRPDADFSEAQSGNATAVIEATDGSLRLTVIL